LKLQYDSEGDGPLVVLLHGFPESRKTWTRQLPALAQAGFRAVAPDLRGYGESPKPHGIAEYRVALVAADVIELIESVGDDPCVLVGHDWGAAVAWHIAMMRPELIRKLVILNVPHPSAIAREVRRSFRQKLKLSYQVFFQLPLLPELVMKIITRQWRRDFTPLLNYYRALRYARERSRRVETETLIVWSEREPVFLPSTIEDIGQWVPNVRIERVPGAGHYVQRDAAERVSECIVSAAKDERRAKKKEPHR
jgi:pimeloyl-ACP methyl ester carboxylesterase